MEKKTDFFELPLGDQHHKECIEIDHSDEYRRGYEDGVESFRAKFEAFKKSLQEHYDEKLKECRKNITCEGCEFDLPLPWRCSHVSPCQRLTLEHVDYYTPKES